MTREQRGMWDSGLLRDGEVPSRWNRDPEGRDRRFYAELVLQTNGEWNGEVTRYTGLTHRQISLMNISGDRRGEDGLWTFGPFQTADEGMAYIADWIAARRRPRTWDLGLMPTGDRYHVDPREYRIPQPGDGR